MNSVKRQKPLGDRLKKGLNEGIRFAKGKLDLKTTTVVLLDPTAEIKLTDAVRIRRSKNTGQVIADEEGS